MNPSRGSVLVGLLWCLALLTVLVVGVLHGTRIDLRVVKNYGDRVQAHYLALAGVERAKALLFHDAASRSRAGRHYTGQLSDNPTDFKDIPLGRGRYRVFRQNRGDETRGVVYGVDEEDGRLNLNTASAEELAKLYELRPETAASIVDWRDEDNSPSPSGAEADFYAALNPPYLPRNGPFQTTRELLMVRGVSKEQFGGEDANQNGLLDPEEDDGAESDPPDNRDGVLDAGWSDALTVHSVARNNTASGQPRINVQSADENTLAGVPGLSTELARAIVQYRGQNKLQSLADLLEVRAMRANPAAQNAPQNLPQNAPANSAPSPAPVASLPGSAPRTPVPSAAPGSSSAPAAQGSAQTQPTGPPLISEDLLTEIADELTTTDDREQPGLVNVNSASAAVLACLPGVNHDLAQAIIAYRKSSGYLANVAWLLKVTGMTRDVFKQLSPRVTVRSETFRILSEGQVGASGARQRILAIVRLGPSSVDTLFYREDL